MPSGPKRRKAAKKKQVKDSNNSNSSSTPHSHHGESDGGELNSPSAQDQQNHQVPLEKNEACLYPNESITVETNEKAEKEEKGDIGIEKGSKLSKSHDGSSFSSISSSLDDEPTLPVMESVPPIESLPEKTAHQVQDSAVVDPIKPADSLLEAESEVHDGKQIEKLVPKSVFSDQMVVVNESASNYNCSTSSLVVESVVVENGASKEEGNTENASLEARDGDLAVSTHPMDLVSGETSQYSDKQPLVASAPRAVQTTSWKGCCGMLELFSSSDRN